MKELNENNKPIIFSIAQIGMSVVLKALIETFSVVQLLINDSGLSCSERFWNTTSIYVYVKNSDPSSPRNRWETPEHIYNCSQLLRKCYNSNCLFVILIKRNVRELNFSSSVVIGRLYSVRTNTDSSMHTSHVKELFKALLRKRLGILPWRRMVTLVVFSVLMLKRAWAGLR